MNILITGCNGQLGKEIQILEKEYTNHIFFNTDIEELDITNKEAVADFVKKYKIEGIVNCAAYTAVDKAENDVEIASRLNGLAPGYLADAINDRGGWIIQVSTDYVFDGNSHTPYTEDMNTCPTGVYGDTKLAGEIAAMQCCDRAMVIRTSWLYSEYGTNFVKTMMRLGETKSELGVIFDQIGTPTYALDLAKAIFTIIEQGIIPGIYHFSNEGVISWYDFTKSIHRIAGINTCHVRPLHTSEYPTTATRPHYSVLDKTKFKNTYGYEIPYWEESLMECIANLKQ